MKRFRITGLLVIISIFLVLAAQSCIKGNEPVKEDYVAGEDVAYTQSLLSNIYDAVLDAAETAADSSGRMSTLFPPTVKIIFTDSLYTDGDGIDYYIQFYPTDSVKLDGGSSCTDERSRGGIIFISQSAKIDQVGAKLTATMRDDSTAHYVGNGTDLVRFNGKITFERSSGGKYIINSKGTAKYKIGKVIFESTESLTPTSTGGPGIWNDSYTMGGTGKGITREGDDFTWFIATTLQKNVKPVCARTYIGGSIEVRNVTNETNITVNFDPKLNNECDRVFALTLINGLSKTYKIN